MIKTRDAKIRQPKEAYIFDYQQPVSYAEAQTDIFWTHREINVDNDIQDLRVNMTEAERHGVITVLKLFTLYEILIGSDYWNGRFKEAFPRPEFELMGSTFGYVEIATHSRFYAQLNEALLINDEEFYLSYKEDPALKSRIDFVNQSVADEDLLYSLAVFSMLEGAVLYSSFAFLKSFQSQGRNLLNNVVRGINFSVRDENLHSEAGAWTFRTLLQEVKDSGIIDPFEENLLEDKIYEAAEHIFEHEKRIIEMIFEKGKIPGLSKDSMISFVKSRLNLCLEQLGLNPVFEVGPNPIADWFYNNINATQFQDFFHGTGNEYSRNWDFSETGF